MNEVGFLSYNSDRNKMFTTFSVSFVMVMLLGWVGIAHVPRFNTMLVEPCRLQDGGAQFQGATWAFPPIWIGVIMGIYIHRLTQDIPTDQLIPCRPIFWIVIQSVPVELFFTVLCLSIISLRYLPRPRSLVSSQGCDRTETHVRLRPRCLTKLEDLALPLILSGRAMPHLY